MEIRSHADTPAFDLGGVWATQPTPFTGTRGWGFDRYPIGGNIYITKLGVFDSGGDGLANSHGVGLWTLGGILLASATVPAGTAAPLEGGYRWASIDSVLIRPDLASYLIGAQYSAGDADDLATPRPVAIPPGSRAFVFANPIEGFNRFGYYAYGPELSFPNQGNSTGELGLGELFFEANFQFSYSIPEPSVSQLLVPGLLFLLRPQRRPIELVHANHCMHGASKKAIRRWVNAQRPRLQITCGFRNPTQLKPKPNASCVHPLSTKPRQGQ